METLSFMYFFISKSFESRGAKYDREYEIFKKLSTFQVCIQVLVIAFYNLNNFGDLRMQTFEIFVRLKIVT